MAEKVAPWRRPVVRLVAAVVLVAVLYLTFTQGISRALDGSGSGAGLWVVVFMLAVLALLVVMLFTLVDLFRRRNTLFSAITIIVCLFPALTIVVFAVLLVNPPTT